MDITKELIEKAKACNTVEELMALAKENECELNTEEAEYLLQEFAEGELADCELDNVAGGQEGCRKKGCYEFVEWKTPEEVQFIFNEGEEVEAIVSGTFDRCTATAKVVTRKVRGGDSCYHDEYWTEKIPGRGKAPLVKRWRKRSEIQVK